MIRRVSDSIDNELYRSLGRLFFAIISREPIGVQMSALSDAVAAMVAKVNEDVAHLRELLDAALATDAADAATIADLRAQADATGADIADAISAMSAVDPDPSFPAAPAPEPPPVEEAVEPSN
jgi:predicted RNase H-like nuclease